MFTKTFTIQKDEDYGIIGLKPSWIPISNAGTGTLIAHDMFEHSATAKFGAAEEELMALGAAHLIRGENGFLIRNNKQTNESVFSNDIYSILYDLGNNERSRLLSRCEKTLPLKNDEAERVFEEAARLGIDQTVEEWEYLENIEEDTPKDSIIGTMLDGDYSTQSLKCTIVDWMRLGYRKATKRYAGVDLYDLARIYKEIGKEVDDIFSDSTEGDEVRISVNMQNMNFTVRNLNRYRW